MTFVESEMHVGLMDTDTSLKVVWKVDTIVRVVYQTSLHLANPSPYIAFSSSLVPVLLIPYITTPWPSTQQLF